MLYLFPVLLYIIMYTRSTFELIRLVLKAAYRKQGIYHQVLAKDS